MSWNTILVANVNGRCARTGPLVPPIDGLGAPHHRVHKQPTPAGGAPGRNLSGGLQGTTLPYRRAVGAAISLLRAYLTTYMHLP